MIFLTAFVFLFKNSLIRTANNKAGIINIEDIEVKNKHEKIMVIHNMFNIDLSLKLNNFILSFTHKYIRVVVINTSKVYGLNIALNSSNAIFIENKRTAIITDSLFFKNFCAVNVNTIVDKILANKGIILNEYSFIPKIFEIAF